MNKPIVGEIEITKTDVATGDPLPNAGFRIKDEAGNIVAEGRTDENGIARFTLRYGKYTYQEFEAPDGYQIDTKEYPFEIKEDGQIIKAQMTNELIPTPQTGADSNVGSIIATVLAVLCVAGGIAMIVINRRKNGKK